MRLSESVSANATSLYIIKSVKIDGKRTTKVVERLGNVEDIRKRLNGADPYKWARERVAELNEQEKKGQLEITARFLSGKTIDKNVDVIYKGGYLFLQSIYHQLGIHTIIKDIAEQKKFQYDLDSILSRLIYTRILYPSSKLSSYEESQSFIEKPRFELHQIYRALEVLAEYSGHIQAAIYKNSINSLKRNTKILYYDVTNYFFDIDMADDLRKFGKSKQNQPNPIVQMGLFMDGDGLPLAFSIDPGNVNEQKMLRPLETQIMKDFGLSKFIVVTDAGLSGIENRKFNSSGERAYVTTQSLKKLQAHLIEWALSPKGWSVLGSDKKNSKLINLDDEDFDDSSDNKSIYFKERWIVENQFEQRLVVTYRPTFKVYQRHIRAEQFARAEKAVEENKSLNKRNQNDPKRFIKETNITKDGEIADLKILTVDEAVVSKEERFDGFYGVCTNLFGKAEEIVQICKNRWQIEESFRIMKTDFKARPVYLRRDDRIKAHFLTCFLSLLVFKVLEKTLDNEYTTTQMIEQLKKIQFYRLPGEGYIPAYTRNDLTDKLHETFGFRTDSEITDEKKMKNIFKKTKKTQTLPTS